MTIEYVDTDQLEIVNSIFDRLNRNGEPLTHQELRRAKYHDSEFYGLIKKAVNIDFWQQPFEKLQKNRLEHEEFTSELLFIILENNIFTGDRTEVIDDLFLKYATNKLSDEAKVLSEFESISEILNSFDLDFEKYKIYGVSHLYGLFGLGWYLNSENIKVEAIDTKLNQFYEVLRNREDNPQINEYKISMSAGTKSRSRRIKRINALLEYLGQDRIK
ncbi:hypothetical protein [Picosynechococcus sp. PCC 73109]|uniref:hypothetical protein n=1 Tax=Picosynechococcus sp. PCC 73109 TaxID=374982 RepID=UPI0018DBB2DB|nr:hypothetical protein [Picosynechococcus sp. PCC 73109]